MGMAGWVPPGDGSCAYVPHFHSSVIGEDSGGEDDIEVPQ